MTAERVSIAELKKDDNIRRIKSIMEKLNPEHNEINVTTDENAVTYITVMVNSIVNMFAEVSINVLNPLTDEYLWLDIGTDKNGNDWEPLKHAMVDINGSVEDIISNIEEVVNKAYREFVE